MNRILVTGGCGFIGSNFVRFELNAYPDLHVTNLDKLTYAGNPDNLADLADDDRCRFVHGDIADTALVERVLSEHGPFDAIVNIAAETHVDRSITEAIPFLEANVVGVQVLLDAARQHGVGRFLQMGTDEVYGSLDAEGHFTEETPLAPNNPYSACKASADMLVQACHHTHGLATVITRCCNNYGPYQFPEKLIPLFIANASADKELPLYGDGMYVREWLHVEDHCRAVDLALRQGRPGQVYNIGSRRELANLDITRTILAQLGKPESLIRFVKDRPGHDRRYAIDPTKIETELGWRPLKEFEQGMADTIAWYADHADWVQRITSGEYRTYYDQQYGERL
jgi:dTDP-glucose 4,6-dehydratase